MRLNTKPIAPHGYTYEGAPAAAMNAEHALRRSVMSCLLWESEFYEDGQEISERIIKLATQVDPKTISEIAVEAREVANLRHVPLLLLSAMARKPYAYTSATIERVIQRADELSELLAVHAKVNGVKPSDVKKKIPAQMKKGIARAFRKFDEYALAKYDRDGAVRLRDALFMVHAKPKDFEQAALWKRLVANELKVPDTWEVQLSGGADKKETFERLIKEGKLGYLALLRNLRNMVQAGCDEGLVRDAIVARKGAYRVLPFRYVAAARAAPQFEPAIDQALCESIAEMPALSGKTVILVDVSDSMSDPLSSKSDLRRVDAAAALASIIHGDLKVLVFNNSVTELAPRRGMAGVDNIVRHLGGGTELGRAVTHVNGLRKIDRLIVITDEQSHDRVPDPIAPHAYMINVASAKNGVGYGKWVHIDGFSEGILKFIREAENDR